ncbi:MAG: EF-hand domain-containing protein [Candidatus Thalassarchaeaceae archaeon]|nr:EF-hand domain-containing protein [Candidatus Thalassarchaeaceae archaeon]
MSEVDVETEGASLPEGIAVDEAAAYFGVTDSADIVVRLNQTDRLNGLGEFFSLTIDLIFQPEFGFEEAANRLGCEGGEIYYLLSGPFGLITISDPLRYYLGQENSEGESGPHPGLPEHEMNAIVQLTDIFSLLRLFGLGHLIGGLPLLAHYITMFEKLMVAPAANKDSILRLAVELHQATEQAKSGSVTPIACLGAPVQGSVPQVAPTPSPPQPTAPPHPAPAPAPPQAPTSPQPVVAPAAPLAPQPTTPIPPSPAPTPTTAPAPTPVPEPTPEPAPQPVVSEAKPSEPTAINFEAANDAFASQFAAAEDIDNNPLEKSQISPQFAFASMDINLDGQLSPDEISQAADISIHEATQLVDSIDSDDDGQISFKEFTDKPLAIEPKRAPIRDDVSSSLPDTTPKLEISSLEAVSSLVSDDHSVKSSSVHNVIQSGKNCPRCGIGVEHEWIYCPVCNAQT